MNIAENSKHPPCPLIFLTFHWKHQIQTNIAENSKLKSRRLKYVFEPDKSPFEDKQCSRQTIIYTNMFKTYSQTQNDHLLFFLRDIFPNILRTSTLHRLSTNISRHTPKQKCTEMPEHKIVTNSIEMLKIMACSNVHSFEKYRDEIQTNSNHQFNYKQLHFFKKHSEECVLHNHSGILHFGGGIWKCNFTFKHGDFF